MSVDEATMRTALTDNTNRSIVRFCRTSHTSKEIVDRITPSTTSDPQYYETLISNALEILENYEMISFSNGQWTSSKASLAVLDKYFGG